MKKTTITLLFCISFVFSSAELTIGEWKTHFSYAKMEQVAVGKNKIYGLAYGSLFSVDKEYESIETYSKLTGLNDNKISHIAYSNEHKCLVIVYNNANIDLLYDDGSIYNITDLYRKNLSVDKTINHVFFKNHAYLSCGFGVLVVNLSKKEIHDTYYIANLGEAVSVKSITAHKGHFYAITEDSLYVAAENSLLTNYENWKTEKTIPAGKNAKVLTFNNYLWILKKDGSLFYKSDANWEKFSNDKWNDCILSNNRLFVLKSDTIKMLSSNTDQTALPLQSSFAVYDNATNNCWITTRNDSLLKVDLSSNEISCFQLNGPPTNDNWEMKVQDNRLFAIAGGRDANQFNKEGYVFYYENGEWNHIKPEEMKVIPMDDSQVESLIPNDFVDIFIDPKDKTHFYTTSYGIGLYEFRNDKFYKLFNAENSGIESIFPDNFPASSFFRYTRLDAMAMDKDENLWFSNMQVQNTLKYLTPKGEIKSFYLSDIENTATMQSLLIPQKNNTQRWVMTFRTEPLVFVFDDNGTLEDRKDDKNRLFTYFIDIDGKTITPDIKFYRSIIEDKNGEIWIGTLDGFIIIKDPKKIFSPDFRCDRIKIPRNDGTNNADYLLDGEQINAIAVDIANRKWIATETSGVYLVSEDGLETIHHFNTDNSPLLSNKVISIAINNQNGEVFFGTENGIISFVTEVTEPAENLDSIRVYPNPVRPDYKGIITIRNLKENTNVKILDLAGNAVYETTSLGGTAIWDHQNQAKISSGIYWIICTTENKKIYGKTKLLILK